MKVLSIVSSCPETATKFISIATILTSTISTHLIVGYLTLVSELDLAPNTDQFVSSSPSRYMPVTRMLSQLRVIFLTSLNAIQGRGRGDFRFFAKCANKLFFT